MKHVNHCYFAFNRSVTKYVPITAYLLLLKNAHTVGFINIVWSLCSENLCFPYTQNLNNAAGKCIWSLLASQFS